MLRYGNQLHEKVSSYLSNIKSKGGHFSLTLDEWTSLQNKRYLNINIHGNGFFLNLGLMRIKGRFSSEACSGAISQKLKEFGIDFETDITAITTNGCAMMKKLGRIIPNYQQLCMPMGSSLCFRMSYTRSKQKHQRMKRFGLVQVTDNEDEIEIFDDCVMG